MKNLIMLLIGSLILTSCGSNTGSGNIAGIDTPRWNPEKTTCNGVVRSGEPVTFSMAMAPSLDYGSHYRISPTCLIYTVGTYTFLNGILTLTETKNSYQPENCDNAALPPLQSFTGPASLAQQSLTWTYVNRRSETCTSYFTR